MVKLQKAVLDIKRTRDVTNLQFVGDGQKQEAIPFGVYPRATHLDSPVEVSKLFAHREGSGIHGKFGTDLSLHLCFSELKTVPVRLYFESPSQRPFAGQSKVQAIPAVPVAVPLEGLWRLVGHGALL